MEWKNPPESRVANWVRSEQQYLKVRFGGCSVSRSGKEGKDVPGDCSCCARPSEGRPPPPPPPPPLPLPLPSPRGKKATRESGVSEERRRGQRAAKLTTILTAFTKKMGLLARLRPTREAHSLAS
jgi:hypothetical protein